MLSQGHGSEIPPFALCYLDVVLGGGVLPAPYKVCSCIENKLLALK